ncbi:squalene epoxidase-domain-containing protein [Lipomyces japonicus]|uniref:squalene epoxidase-domain-containing protein n=1 Tax=Lipomyces japonicus TaxID=56871 RepID=UPI0034D00546
MAQTGSEYDVVIVGAGVVGSALGATLGKQGRRVLVIERDLAEPDRIVGELLQPGGVQALQKLGLSDALEGIDAVDVDGYALFYYAESTSLQYSPDPTNEKLNLHGRSFHHGRFISNLRKAVIQAPNVTVLEATVNEIITSTDSSRVVGVRCTSKKTDLSEVYYGALTVIADGTFSKFRRDYISTPVQIKSHFVGIVLKDAVLPAPNYGHVILGDHSPILIYQIGTHETRLLLDVKGKLPSVGNGDLRNYLEKIGKSALPASVLPSFIEALDTDRLRSMPNSYLPPSTNEVAGVVLLGDAFNMRHPLTGGGMTVALNDVVLLSDLISPTRIPDLHDTGAVLSQLNEFFWKRKSLSTVINILAQALYSLFAADDSKLRRLKNGCFKYLQRGGLHSLEPIGLLSGIIPVPFVLVNHFFRVALFSIFLMFKDADVIAYPALFLESILVLWKAIIIFVPVLWNEWK